MTKLATETDLVAVSFTPPPTLLPAPPSPLLPHFFPSSPVGAECQAARSIESAGERASE